MNHYLYKTVCVILFCLLSSTNYAADLLAGKALSSKCQACHGADGISVSPQWPTLAGQTSNYLEAQLIKFKTGARINALMKPQTDSLSATDIQNIAGYFASLTPKSAGGDPNLTKQGKDKAAMCMGCHGDKLQGKGQFPRLAGQQAQYLSRQLLDFKNNVRVAGPMNALAQSLSDDDIKAVAAYLSSL